MSQSPTAGPSTEIKLTGVQEAPQLLVSGGAGTNVEIDDELDTDAGESGISTGESTATTSISSSIFDYTYSNGRRYHSDRFRKAHYFLPNDETEQDRLDLYHHMFLMFLGGGLHAAPLTKPQRVLDAGTGTGIWAIDFADENPQAEVIGPDISPIQPGWVPQNCRFEVDDLEEPWTYKSDYFDYIHMRSMSGSFSNWEAVMGRTTAPGGYFEFQDYGVELFRSDGTKLDYPAEDSPTAIWLHGIVKASEKLNRPLVMGKRMKGLMEKVGFINVKEDVAIWPVGDWPKDKRLKEIGRWGLVGITDSLHPFTLMLMQRTENWSEQQVEETCKSVAEDLRKGKYYFQAWFVYGQKPLDA
ncbi:S-adenosyl-L-methionine-dependent methyltransferase [Kalaharituber pfeilii]|nr:S-adenosyl-L-methionine-dependent methyltransferase [Kalaharituber pfeilii]